MIIVSSCLAGMKVRYNGTDCPDEIVKRLIDEKKAIPVCPELLGGFGTPREPAEIFGGTGEDVLDGRARVMSKSGEDVSGMYVKGAYETLRVVKESGATAIVLKEFSPSCGSSRIYDGSFGNRKIAGNGVTAALLKREGFAVLSENDSLLSYLED
ncbi:DUF523 domain-containing protein [Paenibacillus sp. M1]|uniref:DUF523 domain-containing protein n=1 Tax=Paenibacillus haidiansis TaxID=1574488 RepID=A0ABU7VTL8_9BACL